MEPVWSERGEMSRGLKKKSTKGGSLVAIFSLIKRTLNDPGVCMMQLNYTTMQTRAESP